MDDLSLIQPYVSHLVLRSLKRSLCWSTDLIRSLMEVATQVGSLLCRARWNLICVLALGKENLVQGEEPRFWVLVPLIGNPGGHGTEASVGAVSGPHAQTGGEGWALCWSWGCVTLGLVLPRWHDQRIMLGSPL